ncbi:MAG: glycosyltransferase family 2 protein [Chloroflexota bacterium]|nr:glycosyltransferase family 2 protein [Chloroflexota bacterium]
MSNRIDLSICIVNWNAGHFLLDCVASIQKNLIGLEYEIIIVDNASTDNSISLFQEHFPDVKVVLCARNDGFAVANNIAIARSRGRYVLLLNPDTLVYEGTLEEMVRFMDEHPFVGACGPRLVNPDSGNVEISARAFPTLLPLLWNLSYLDRLFPYSSFFSAYQMTYRRDDEIREVDWVTGACLMARRKASTQVGELDSHIFMYLEDVDWCYRFKRAGWQVFYLPMVQIAHYRGQSSKLKLKREETELGVWGTQQYTQSVLYFYHKHYGILQTCCLRIIITLTSLLKAGIWLLDGTLRGGSWRVGSGRARSYLSTIPVALTWTFCELDPSREHG